MSEQFSGTKAVTDFLKFDLKVLNSYLQEPCPEIDEIIEYKQFKGGQSNPSYLLKSISKSYVLRRKPPGNLLKSAHAVDREYRVLTALMSTEIPSPSSPYLCEDDRFKSTAFYLMEFCDGNFYCDPVTKEIERTRRL